MQSKKFTVYTDDPYGIIIPNEIALPFYEKSLKRILIKAFYNKKYIEFHAALRKLHGTFVVYFGQRLHKELGTVKGDKIELQFFEDTSKYGVVMPEELSAVLESDWEANERFENLSDGKKRSLIYYIIRFKNIQTKVDKALLIAENLKKGIVDTKELIKKNSLRNH